MARTVAPGTPQTVNAPQVKIPNVSFKAIDDLADKELKSATQNYKLWADVSAKQAMNSAYDQFKNDPAKLTVALENAAKTLPEGLPEDIQNAMRTSMITTSAGLISKAYDNQANLIDQQNRQMTDQGILEANDVLITDYTNLLRNNAASAEDKDPFAENIYDLHVAQRSALGELKNRHGKYVYSEKERESLRMPRDQQLAAFKSYFDNMIMNDNENLETSQAYYKSQILAPDRFIAQNKTDRATYESMRTYAEQRLRQAGADIKKARFTQSVKDAMSVQGEYDPQKIANLRSAGLINSKIIDSIESATTKFNNIDPSKPELPTTMLEMLDIVNSWDDAPNARTPEEIQATLEQGTMALDALAEYGQTYGMSPKSVQAARQMIVMKESDQAYGEMLDRFGQITQSFGTAIPDMREKMNYIRGNTNLFDKNVKLPSKKEIKKLTALNDAIAVTEDASREALRRGDIESYNQLQTNLSKTVAQIKYSGGRWDTDWIAWQKNADHLFEHGGQLFTVKGFTPDGDIIIETKN